MLTRSASACGRARNSASFARRFGTASTPLVSTRHGAPLQRIGKNARQILDEERLPAGVKESWRTPSATASSMKGCTSSKLTRPRRRSPGREPSRQNGQARLHAVPV